MLGVIVIVVFSVLLLVCIFVLYRNRKFIVRCFCKGNVVVTGHKGRGKDLLFSFVTNYRWRKKKEKYISNVDYSGGKGYSEFDFKYMDLGGNSFENFLNNSLVPYEYRYKEGRDFYIADAGVYLPSTYHDKLVKKYGEVPLFYAIQRHLADSNTHVNIQNLNRLWDKLREQADYYIDCLSARVLFGKIVIQQVCVYDTYESALQRLRPMKIPRGLIMRDKTAKALSAQRDADRGLIKRMTIVSMLPRKHYDTRYFKEILKRGSIYEVKSEDISDSNSRS